MRQLCWPLLAVVLVRFVLNPEVLHYGRVFWGYAISVVALAVATRFLADDRLRRAVQAGAVLLAFVMLTLEVRILFRPGDMEAPDAAFLERSVYVAVWGAFALAALWIARLRHDPVALWAWRLSGGLAVATVLVVQVLVANPVFERADVGALPIANGLLLAYALPAVHGLRRAALDGHRAQPGRQPAGRGHGRGPGLRLCLARSPASSSIPASNGAASAPRGSSSTPTRSSGCCSAWPCWRSASGATCRRCATPAWRWSAWWSPRSS